MAHRLARLAATAVLLLLAGALIELALFTLASGRPPNSLAFPALERAALIETLLRSNPAAAAALLVEEPLLVIAHREPAAALPVWGLYAMPLAGAVRLGTAFWLAAVVLRAPTARWPLAAAGAALLAAATCYVRLAACCTVGPSWIAGVWLLLYAYDPTATAFDWQALHQALAPYLALAQWACGLLGAALLWRAAAHPPQRPLR